MKYTRILILFVFIFSLFFIGCGENDTKQETTAAQHQVTQQENSTTHSLNTQQETSSFTQNIGNTETNKNEENIENCTSFSLNQDVNDFLNKSVGENQKCYEIEISSTGNYQFYIELLEGTKTTNTDVCNQEDPSTDAYYYNTNDRTEIPITTDKVRYCGHHNRDVNLTLEEGRYIFKITRESGKTEFTFKLNRN
jgi:hypothetical protein